MRFVYLLFALSILTLLCSAPSCLLVGAASGAASSAESQDMTGLFAALALGGGGSSGGGGGEASGGGGGSSGPDSIPGTGALEETDLGTELGLGNNNGGYATTLFDAANDKLLITTATGGDSLLFRCNRDVTGCTFTNISTTSTPEPPYLDLSDYPRGFIAGSRLMVAQTEQSFGNGGLTRCNLDGTGCTYTVVTSTDSGHTPRPYVDTHNNQIRIFLHNEFTTHSPYMINRNLDGSSGGAGALISTTNYYHPNGFFNATDGKLLVVARNTGNLPVLFRCDANGANCTSAIDISAGGNGINSAGLTALNDSVNQKLLVVAKRLGAPDSGSLALYRCEYTGAGCTYHNISAGEGMNSGNTPSPVIDTVNRKLLVTAENTNTDLIGLFRCDLDGTNCTYTQLSATTGALPSSAIDPVNGKLVTAFSGTGSRLFVVRN